MAIGLRGVPLVDIKEDNLPLMIDEEAVDVPHLNVESMPQAFGTLVDSVACNSKDNKVQFQVVGNQTQVIYFNFLVFFYWFKK